MAKNDKGYFFVAYPDSLKDVATEYITKLESYGLNFMVNEMSEDTLKNASKILLFIDETFDKDKLKQLIYFGFDNKKTVITLSYENITMDKELKDLIGSTYIIKNNKYALSNIKEALLMLSIAERNIRRKKIYSFFVIIILILTLISILINGR